MKQLSPSLYLATQSCWQRWYTAGAIGTDMSTATITVFVTTATAAVAAAAAIAAAVRTAFLFCNLRSPWRISFLQRMIRRRWRCCGDEVSACVQEAFYIELQ